MRSIWRRREEGARQSADGKETNGMPVSEAVMCRRKERGRMRGKMEGGLD